MTANARHLAALLLLCAAMFCIAGCSSGTDEISQEPLFRTYREIPGVTEQEITAIEALKRGHNSFIYGSTPSTEAFINENGAINGYTALFCEWLTELFGIKFDIRILEWIELTEKRDAGDIDFSIHFLSGDENMENYFISDPIAERQFIITHLAGNRSISQIARERKPRYAFTVSSPTESSIAAVLGRDTYEPVWVNNYNEAYSALERGDADALITTKAAEANFIAYDNMIHEDFLPLSFSPVSMISANPELEVIISVLNKALRNGATPYLNELYNTGYDDYRQYKFLTSLNAEEKAYLKNTAIVPLAAQYFNYPMVFFNRYNNKWDGITFDLLRKVEKITGLVFQVVNGEHTEMYDLMQMLNDGRAHMFSDMVLSAEREPHYIWANHKLMADQYALLSKTNFPNVTINEIPNARIALIKNTAHTEMFQKWFPNAVNTVLYNAADEAFFELEKDEVDMVMAAKSKLLYYANYYEFSGYKVNYLFNYFYESAFAFNKEQVVLRSILDKALSVIDTNIIVEQWITRTYDYQTKMLKAQLPLLIGAISLSLVVLLLLLLIFHRNKSQSIKLKKEHERARVMLDTLPIACFMGTTDGKIYDCNNEALRLFELKDRQEFIDHFTKDLSPEFQPDGRSSYEWLIRYGIMADENNKCTFNWTHQLLDGTPIPVIVTLENVTYNDGKVLMAYIRDMREHAKMTDEIDRQNELLKTVNSVSSTLLEPDIGHFEDTLKKSMGIMAEVTGVDRINIWKNLNEGHWLRFSLGYMWEKTGFKSQAKDGELAPDLWFDEHPAWNEILSKGNCMNSLVRSMSSADQAELTPRNILSILVVPVFFQDHFWGMVGFDHCRKEHIFKDSEVLIMRSASRMIANAIIRNEMANELVYAKEQAEKSNRSKSIFLSHMSHEIRTPMNAILGIAEIQLRNENLPEDTLEAYGKIYESGDLLLNIINDILDLSKIESGKLELAYAKYDIPSLINDTAQLIRLRFDSKPIQFYLHIDENTPIDLFGDELRIKQILNNILSNAFKYTDEGKIDFYISSESEQDSPDDNVTLIFRICDTGQGMTNSQIERLFDEYSRFNLEKNRTTVGAGLGMSITKRLTDLMNGTISVRSKPEKGSEFIVRLPQKRLGTAVCGAELTEKLRDFNFLSTSITKKTRFLREYMPYGSVLVVDDVESNIYVTKGMLLPYGLKIDTAHSGIEAIEKIKNGEVYDIIFMDHMMPKMDGIEATKIIHSLGYTKPIIALTANALVGRAEMFMKNGFDGFISKPIDSRELNLFLNDFIRNKQPPEIVAAAQREQLEKKLAIADVNAQEIQRSSEMIELFLLDAKNAINILEDLNERVHALSNADIEIYITTVHGMKSALNNVGEKELSGIAFKLEQAGEEHDLAILSNVTPIFLNSLRSLVSKLKPAEKENNTEVSESDIIFLREKMLEIQTACAEFNKNTAKALLNDLKQKKWPPNINAILEDISINILHSAFKKAVATVENYLQVN